MFKMAVNDSSGRYFGAMADQLQSYDKIGLTNAEGVSQVRVNGDLLRGFDTGCKNKNTKTVEVILHNISEEMRVPLQKMCIKDEPGARDAYRLALSKQKLQREARKISFVIIRSWL